MKKDTDILEYVFTRRQFKRRMWSYLFMYLGIRVIRTILFLIFGAPYLISVWALLLVFANGIVFGMAILTIIYYRRAIQIE